MRGGFRRIGVMGILCGLSVVACGSDDDADADESVTIGWLAKGSGNTFFDLSRHAADLAAQDLSSASGRDVSVVHLDSEETTPEAQADRIDAAIEMKVDALDVSCLDPSIVGPAIDRAVDAGIPVITFDSDAPDTQRTSFYGISNLNGAVTAANILAGLMGETGKIAIMTAAGAEPGTLSTDRKSVV